MTIKTLSEILAEMGESPVSAESYQPTVLDASNFYALTTTKPAFKQPQLRAKKPASAKHTTKKTANKPQTKLASRKAADAHDTPSHQTQPKPSTASDEQTCADEVQKPKAIGKTRRRRQAQDDTPKIKSLLDEAKLGQTNAVITDKLAAALSDVAIEPLAINDRATNYMRWLAFYYLSNRELSQHELRQKLLAKDCDPVAVDALIEEFAEKGYQSDERCAAMLIRESIRKGRGKIHIRQALKSAHIALPDSLDVLIEQAGIDSLTDGTALADDDGEEVDWLRLAVEARTRKYGDSIPTTPKEKARQLRFLQYRGFEMGVCLDALKLRPSDF